MDTVFSYRVEVLIILVFSVPVKYQTEILSLMLLTQLVKLASSGVFLYLWCLSLTTAVDSH